MNITDLGEREPNFNGLLRPLTPVYISTKFLSEFIQNLSVYYSVYRQNDSHAKTTKNITSSAEVVII